MPEVTWTKDALRTKYHDLSDTIRNDPYSFLNWNNRAKFFASNDYHDLAVGDFYRSLLLLDDALDPSGEYHNQSLQSLTGSSTADDGLLQDEATSDTIQRIRAESVNCYIGLAQCLLALGCLYDAIQFCQQGLNIDPANIVLQETKSIVNSKKPASNGSGSQILPKRTFARREIYPWNAYEPDRYTSSAIESLNERLGKISQNCVVRIVTLPVLDSGDSVSSPVKPATTTQLGLFAVRDIPPGSDVLKEKSLLAVNNRLHDDMCDACSACLSADPDQSFACGDCQTAVFCSRDCIDQAMQSYHPAVCDNESFEAINKDVNIEDATDALYGLLVGRAIAMSETQDLHPLELAETRFLWGDYSSEEMVQEKSHSSFWDKPVRECTLPWSFEHNIAGPIHLLTTLDLDVFVSIEKYDFWVFNTLFAKFRGVANARMDRKTGKPEVAAVHPLWCLANHSCAPNVTWEWGGEICMRARCGAKGEVVKWGPEAHSDENWQGGISSGEEILNHYCDVQLPVKERREWAAGALGGNCLCERCRWESAQVDDV